MKGRTALKQRINSAMSVTSAVTTDDEKMMLQFEINRLTLGWEVACRRRSLVKALDQAIQQGNSSSAMKIGTRICALDAEFCFGISPKEYLKSRSK